ncbi:MAG: PfkB family carbohydrate kinase, partial [Bacteroidota bacterium]
MKSAEQGQVVCVVASLVDLTFRCEQEPVPFTSNPSRLHRSPGGVVRNIAHHLALLKIPVQLVTILGEDPDGHWLAQQCSDAGIGLDHVLFAEEPTGTFASIATPSGDLHIGAVTSETDRLLTIDFFSKRSEVFR